MRAILLKLKTGMIDLTNSKSNALLTGCILLATVDLSGLLDYTLKAAVGGAIWLGFKLTAEYLSKKRRDKQ